MDLVSLEHKTVLARRFHQIRLYLQSADLEHDTVISLTKSEEWLLFDGIRFFIMLRRHTRSAPLWQPSNDEKETFASEAYNQIKKDYDTLTTEAQHPLSFAIDRF